MTTPPDRWRDDVVALDGAACDLREQAKTFDVPGADKDSQDIANQYYQEAYACDRAALLLTALMDPNSPERRHVVAAVQAIALATPEKP